MCSGDAVVGLTLGVDAVAALDVASLPDREVRDAVLLVWEQTCRLQAQLTRLVGAFDARQACQDDAARTTVAWLRGFCRMTGAQASALVRAGQVTRQLPDLAAAFTDGQVSAAHVDRITDLARRVGADRVGEVEAVLVEAAK